MERDNKGRIKKGNIPWNKGIQQLQECKDKISKSKKGQIPWNKGIPQSPEAKEKNRLAHLEIYDGKNNPFYGREHSEKSKQQMSKTKTGIPQSAELIESKTGVNSAKWLGGKSFEPYSIVFNNKLKRDIRQRDGLKCQNCGELQKQYKIKLHIHHIDYDKENNALDNLISLCKSCHGKTNKNREYWQKHFEFMIWFRKQWLHILEVKKLEVA